MTTDHLTYNRPAGHMRHAASKVPEVTVYFWIIKVLTTGMGETASDWLAHLLGPIPAVGLGGIALVAALAVQFTVRRYVAWVYWTAIVMVSVFGTMAADVLHVGLGVPYTLSTPRSSWPRWPPSSPSGTAARAPCPSTASTPGAARP